MIDQDRARELRAEGQTLQAIGDELGVSRERIRQIVGPTARPPLSNEPCLHCGEAFAPSTHANAKNKFCSENCRKRAWERANRPTCKCGAVMSKSATQCWDCARDADDARRLERWKLIDRLYREGLFLNEIASRVGLANRNVLGVQIDRMRKAGWDLPFRHPGAGRSDPGPRIVKDVYTHTEAANRLNHAVRTGAIKRPNVCERCDSFGRVEGHHHDYSKPLDVEWLCRHCHAAHHSAERKAAA